MATSAAGTMVSTIRHARVLQRSLRGETLRTSFADAVERLKPGWANNDGLRVGTGANYFARYFRLAGAPAGLRIDYEDEKQRPDRSLCLWFWHERNARLAVDDVARLLDQEGEAELEWRGTEVFLPIVLPEDADDQATVNTIVAELERIALLLDRDGPTYRDASDSGAMNDRQPDERRHPPGGQTLGGAAIKVVSWNIATMIEPWRELVAMDARCGALAGGQAAAGGDRRASGYWPTRVVGLAFVEFGLVARALACTL